MRVVIVGQKWLGEQVLSLCHRRGHEVAAVFTPAAATDGGYDRLYVGAQRLGIDSFTVSARLGAAEVPACDLIIAAHAHCFISAAARARSKYGALGYHPPLLPLHRGRDAVRWAIHMRERVAGGTVYLMDDGADTGGVIAQDWCFIRPDDTAAGLWRRELAPMGLRLFDKVLGELAANGAFTAAAQDEALATWEPSFGRPPLSK